MSRSSAGTDPAEGFHAWVTNLQSKGVLVSGHLLSEWHPKGPLAVLDHQFDQLRRAYNAFSQKPDAARDFVTHVLEEYLGHAQLGVWEKEGDVSERYRTKHGKPNRVLRCGGHSHCPRFLVFIDETPGFTPAEEDSPPQPRRLKGKKDKDNYARILRVLRTSGCKIAVQTNGQTWRLIYAALDTDAYWEFTADDWFQSTEGRVTAHALRALIGIDELPCEPDGDHTKLLADNKTTKHHPLLYYADESRDNQADLSQVMGVHVREAVEIILDAYNEQLDTLDPGERKLIEMTLSDVCNDQEEERRALYQAAIRIVMRLVIGLYSEARGLMPVASPTYQASYSIEGLYTQLKAAKFQGHSATMQQQEGAWRRLNALFYAIHDGTHHPDVDIFAYGGHLFQPPEKLERHDPQLASALLCLQHQWVRIHDLAVYQVLQKLKVGKFAVPGSKKLIPGNVDYSTMRTEFIGMMYEGLLDYDIRQATEKEGGIVFLNAGDEPAMPLNALKSMKDADIKKLYADAKSKAKSSAASTLEEEEEEYEYVPSDEEETYHELRNSQARRIAEMIPGFIRAGWKKEQPTVRERLLAEAAEKVFSKSVAPGGFYLVAWSGTRKGSGTFYTKPGLAIPTARRTLEPLCYDDGVPKLPREILEVKVCDPAMGSGSFLVAATNYLAQVLTESIDHHQDNPEAKLAEIGVFADEYMDFRDGKMDLETLEAKAKRLVVEHCIYGVDLNPLAVELGKLSLWIETMDRDLRFSFLDHKIKCGNALMGAWLHQASQYPIAAWGRDGALSRSKNDKDGINHDAKLAEIRKDVIAPQFKRFLELAKVRKNPHTGQQMVTFATQKGVDEETPDVKHQSVNTISQARQIFKRLHEAPDEQTRQQIYEDKILGNEALAHLKHQLDMWCSIWHWPVSAPDAIQAQGITEPKDFVLGPDAFYGKREPHHDTIIEEVARRQRYFHWELEFPEIFNDERFGFDCMLGNPPWDIAKPNSQEFFTRYDPEYRRLGKQAALKRQKELFDQIGIGRDIEEAWVEYQDGFKAFSNYVRNAHKPFELIAGLGRLADSVKQKWLRINNAKDWSEAVDRYQRVKDGEVIRASGQATLLQQKEASDPGPLEQRPGFVTPYAYQGGGDINLYKLFTERFHGALNGQGRMGIITPAGLWTDAGTADLRDVFYGQCSVDWIYGFENRKHIFDIYYRVKFTVSILARGGATVSVKAQSMVQYLRDWTILNPPHAIMPLASIKKFSPGVRALLEVVGDADIAIAERMYRSPLYKNLPFGYQREFDMTNEVGVFTRREKLDSSGWAWPSPASNVADVLPAYNGAMLFILRPTYRRYRGGGRWSDFDGTQDSLEPKFWLDRTVFRDRCPEPKPWKVAIRDISSPTNLRTMIVSIIPDLPCGEKTPVLTANPEESLRLAACFSSYVLDHVVKLRSPTSGIKLFLIRELPVAEVSPRAKEIVRQLTVTKPLFDESSQPSNVVDSVRRAELLEELDELVAQAYGVDHDGLRWILRPTNEDPRNLWRDYRKRLEILEAAGKQGKWYTLAEAKKLREEAGLLWKESASEEGDDEPEEDES